MLQFKHPHDLKQLPEVHAAYPIIKDLVERLIVDFPPHRAYSTEDDGWIALIEEQDIDRGLSEIWLEIPPAWLGAGPRHYKQQRHGKGAGVGDTRPKLT
jgi:hypothetical protein